VSISDARKIELDTRGQSSNEKWKHYRSNRLTASNFGRVCKMRSNTHPHNTVVSILYPENIDHLPAIKHGKEREAEAISELNEILAKKGRGQVSPCGLFVDIDTGFLAASPDGILDEDTLVEIKCPIKLRENKIEELCNSDSTFCLNAIGDKKYALKKNHNYFYQIQGQLHCAKRKKCIFMVWSPTEYHMETIYYDQEFWAEMGEKLDDFFLSYILPEIVDPRAPRGKLVRDPENRAFGDAN